MDFMECEACSREPGCPMLCKGCINNRQLIYDLQDKVKRCKSAQAMLHEALRGLAKAILGLTGGKSDE